MQVYHLRPYPDPITNAHNAGKTDVCAFSSNVSRRVRQLVPVSRLLVGDHPRIPGIVFRDGIAVRFGQAADIIGEGAGVAMVYLQGRRCAFGIVKSAGGNLDLIVIEILQCQRGPAIAAKPSSADIGACEQTSCATRPLQSVCDNQWCIESSKSPLTHAAVAHGRTSERYNAVTHGSALATTRNFFRFSHGSNVASALHCVQTGFQRTSYLTIAPIPALEERSTKGRLSGGRYVSLL